MGNIPKGFEYRVKSCKRRVIFGICFRHSHFFHDHPLSAICYLLSVIVKPIIRQSVTNATRIDRGLMGFQEPSTKALSISVCSGSVNFPQTLDKRLGAPSVHDAGS